MVNIRHLKNPPIIESLFDIRVKARPEFDVNEFQQLKEPLSNKFTEILERRESKVTLTIPQKDSPRQQVEDLGLQGYFFKSDEEKLIAQYRIDGFTLNKLKPYTSWDELIPITLDHWKKYVEIAKPDAITRIALRYINHIKIESEYIDFDEYLTAAPQIPPELPQSLNSFLTRVSILDAEDGKIINIANVIQEFKPAQDIIGILIILDIDTFRLVDISPKESNVKKVFSELRGFKNKLFFNFLTDKTLELFE